MARTYLMQPLGPCKFAILLYCVFVSVTQAHPLFLNTTLSDELHPQCTDSNDWMNGGFFNPNHCLDALGKLEHTDLKLYKSRDIEFLAPGAKSRTNLDTVRLPRRYTSESCTIIIAMLSTITEHFLPGQVRQADEYGNTDRSKFSYLWSIAAWLDGTCVSKASMLGWCATGTHSNIGVFVVGTKSKVNTIISSGLLLGNTNRSANWNVNAS
ncbi:MAG: hypothetical protein L6R38_008123 [Xanthoria sp. 2 TBL-2021]|nr:MAG: hypothetical protein L6R38_008123 [Xanthoria sp. 2 TBL-2021]